MPDQKLQVLSEPCKVQAVLVHGSKAKNKSRYLFGVCTGLKGDTATIVCGGGRIVQAFRNDVVFAKRKNGR